MGKKHFVAFQNPDSKVEIHPMKGWLSQNSQHLPKGMDAGENTSYQLRRALVKNGWELEELTNKVLLILPNQDGDTSFVYDLLGEVADIEEDNEDALAEAEAVTFGLEYDLQAALRANIEQLEQGLKIIDGGKERNTEAGRIDITAIDSKGSIVVIELKAGMAQPESIAQILAYMGSVSETDNKPVRGILIAGDFHKKVILAARTISSLELKKYSFVFNFKPVQ